MLLFHDLVNIYEVATHRMKEAEIIRRKKENHIVVQLTLIVTSFFIGYMPMTGDMKQLHVKNNQLMMASRLGPASCTKFDAGQGD